MRTRPVRATALLALALLAALAGCRREQAPAPPAAAPAPAPAAVDVPVPAPPIDAVPRVVPDATPVDAHVVDVALAADRDDARIGHGRSRPFAPTDAVFLAVRTDGSASGYTLSAKWLAPDGSVLTEYGQAVGNAGSADTVLSLSRPDGWPAGDYRVELAINGQPARTVAFAVR
jgi:hypothetical protein